MKKSWNNCFNKFFYSQQGDGVQELFPLVLYFHKMATIYNSDCTKGLANNAGIQVSREQVPNQLADKIVPTFETNPQLLRTCIVRHFNSNTSAGSTTLLPADANRDFYITGLRMSYAQNAVCDVTSANVSITATQDGVARHLISLPILTLRELALTEYVPFTIPFKIDRNTSIQFTTSSFTVGVCLRNYAVYGYYIDNPNV